jgi:hypothetical protein
LAHYGDALGASDPNLAARDGCGYKLGSDARFTCLASPFNFPLLHFSVQSLFSDFL